MTREGFSFHCSINTVHETGIAFVPRCSPNSSTLQASTRASQTGRPRGIRRKQSCKTWLENVAGDFCMLRDRAESTPYRSTAVCIALRPSASCIDITDHRRSQRERAPSAIRSAPFLGITLASLLFHRMGAMCNACDSNQTLADALRSDSPSRWPVENHPIGYTQETPWPAPYPEIRSVCMI